MIAIPPSPLFTFLFKPQQPPPPSLLCMISRPLLHPTLGRLSFSSAFLISSSVPRILPSPPLPISLFAKRHICVSRSLQLSSMTRHKRYNSRMKEGVQHAMSKGKPQKKFFRMRAHCNPLTHSSGFTPPTKPEDIDWEDMYADGALETGETKKVEIADVGCGFGGLTVELARIFPESRILAMEIRVKVAEYVRLRIQDLREKHPGQYGNASVLQTNAMKYLPNYFEKGQLKKIFFCFPDPHFKAKNHRRRIITNALLAEYAYVLQPGGMLYTITDVLDLHKWMASHGDEHPAFDRVTDEELDKDPAVHAMTHFTEEGMKVARNKGSKYRAVFRRVSDDELTRRLEAADFWDSPADSSARGEPEQVEKGGGAEAEKGGKVLSGGGGGGGGTASGADTVMESETEKGQ